MNQPQEKEWTRILLYLQKMETSLLCTATTESASDQVRNHLTGILNKSLENQKNLFEIMNQKGWYRVESAPSDVFQRTQQQFQTMQQQMQ
jgi:spore coat protein CotF